MQLSSAENDLSEQLKELHVSAEALSCWKEEIHRAALSKTLLVLSESSLLTCQGCVHVYCYYIHMNWCYRLVFN